MRVTNAKLDDVIELLTDYHANGSYEKLKDNVELLHDENYAVMIRTTNFSQNDFNNNLNYITESAYNYLKKSKVFPNDIIMNKIADAGACYFMPDLGKPVSLGMNLFLIRINPKLADSYYIYSYLKYHEHYVKSFASGSATKTITKNDVRKLKILTPPLPEQQKIAKILTTWGKAIDTTERLIDNSKQQKKALMQQLLTGKKRLLDDNGKPFEGEWDEFQLSDLALSGKNNFTDGDWVESVHIKESGCRLIQTGNIGVGYFKNKNKKYISQDSFDELKCTEVHVGDLLICRLAEPAGRACIVPDIGESKMLTSVDVIIMRTDTTKALAKYLSYYFSLNHTLHRVSALCGGSTRSRVSRSVLGKMKLSLPNVQEQQKIATVLTNADKEIELLEQQLADLQQEKKALMQVLLTGKKRVVVDGED